jgi:hypothetical protein
LGINYVYRSSSFLITHEPPAFLERAKPPPVSPPVLHYTLDSRREGIGRLQRQLPYQPALRKKLQAVPGVSISNVKSSTLLLLSLMRVRYGHTPWLDR